MDPRDDMLFGKIALNWRLITRDLLNRALHYQRTQDPNKPLGEILLEKGILSRDQVNDILAYQQRINRIKSSQIAVPHMGASGVSPTASMPQMPPTGPAPYVPGGTAASFIGGGGSTAIALGPTPSPDNDPLLGTVVGGCHINAKIGQGGMGSIYLAHHTALRKDVVVKILPPESSSNPRTVERFFREARASAKLEHPNIVATQDVGTTDGGLHFIVMQYIDGQNLEEKIRSDGQHKEKDATDIVLQVARGLRAAHQADVIHRDIKAENILITTGGTVKVTDFGLAKDLNSELKLTADGAMIGTPLYMAPEIGRVKEIDGRVDIYSLGVTFYYLITGIQPFRGFSALEILSAKAHDKLKPPEVHAPLMSDTVRNVLGKMLEKDRDQRYRNIDELLRDLEALERNFPVSAGLPSIWPPRAAPGSESKIVKRKRGLTSKLKRDSQPSKKKKGGLSPALIVALVGAVMLVLGLIAVLIWLILN
jgi:tRNA A-37 threonylcarbamoyl transferase component Bud32